jgi:hypothetical protein
MLADVRQLPYFPDGMHHEELGYTGDSEDPSINASG